MVRERAIAITIAALVVFGTLPGTAAAAGVPGMLLFNQGTTEVATVAVDGQTYHVYRYDNRFRYASGLAIYADGEKITSEETAREVFTALARRRAADEIGQDDLRVLQRVKRNVSAAQRAATDALRTINETLRYTRRLHERTVNGTNAWTLAVDAAPKLEQFNESARRRREELREFLIQSDEFDRDARRLVDLIQRQHSDADVPPRKLYRRYAAVFDAAGELEEQVAGYGAISDQLYELANTSESIAANASAVPEIGDEMERRFGAVANESRIAADRLRAFSDDVGQSRIDEAQETVESRRSEWLDAWRTRRHATREVYATVFGLPLVAIGAIAVGWWRWQ